MNAIEQAKQALELGLKQLYHDGVLTEPAHPKRVAVTTMESALAAISAPAQMTDAEILEIGTEWAKEPGWFDFERNDFIRCARAIESRALTSAAGQDATSSCNYVGMCGCKTPCDAAPAQPQEQPVAAQQDDEREEDAFVINRLATVLAEVAIALKGPELPLHRHGYHDLGQLAQTIVLERDLLRHQVEELTAQEASAPAQAAEGVTDGFYIAAFHRRQDGVMYWWGPDHAGYTPDLETAGIYTKAEADEITQSSEQVAVPVSFIRDLRVRRIVDYGDSKNTMFWTPDKLRAALAASHPQAAQQKGEKA